MFDLLSIRGNRGNLLFAAVQNISSNRCVHCSTVFRRFLTVSMAMQVLQGRDFADLSDPITVVLICFVTLHLLYLSPVPLGVFVKCLALHSGEFRFPLKRGFFLTGSRHVIIFWTSVSLISHNLSVLIKLKGVSRNAGLCRRCSPYSSAAVSSPT